MVLTSNRGLPNGARSSATLSPTPLWPRGSLASAIPSTLPGLRSSKSGVCPD